MIKKHRHLFNAKIQRLTSLSHRPGYFSSIQYLKTMARKYELLEIIMQEKWKCLMWMCNSCLEMIIIYNFDSFNSRFHYWSIISDYIYLQLLETIVMETRLSRRNLALCASQDTGRPCNFRSCENCLNQEPAIQICK